MQIAITDHEISVFQEGLRALNESGISYVVGGAFALHHYTSIWRNTHDLDVYIQQRYAKAVIDVLIRTGFEDRGEMAIGDRDWIFHAAKDDILLDVIWQAPNRLMPVSEHFYSHSEPGTLFGVPVRFIPPDDLFRTKVYTLNRQRCDWPDLFALVRACPARLDWSYILQSMDANWPVLLSFVVLFDWVYPSEAHCIPRSLRIELLRRKQEQPVPEPGDTKESILDPWIYTRPVAP